MWKNLVIVTVLVIGGLWGLGFDFAGLKDDIAGAANGNADQMVGRGGPADWGDED